MNAILALSLLAPAQASPQDMPKGELPRSAICAACFSLGRAHGEEKPAAGVRYLGQAFFFCNAKEVVEFKKDPDAFLPPVLPRPAPSLSATSLDGQEVTLEQCKGKVVLLDFWATWCVPCVKAMPALEAFYAARQDKGFVVLGISIDQDQKKVAPFLKKRSFSYPILLDRLDSPTWDAYKVKTVPALFLIDREGQIVAQWKGEPKMAEVEKAIDAALKKR